MFSMFLLSSKLLSESVQKHVEAQVNLACNKLTVGEYESISCGNTQHMRAAKTILCALFPCLESQFGAEAIVKEVKKVRRILKRRI
jgi:hypothetical protein